MSKRKAHDRREAFTNEADTYPIKGATYIHNKTGQRYIVEESVKIKVGSVWVGTATIYRSCSDGSKYARLTSDFMRAFKKSSKESMK